ncbi:hypothetical protein DXG03_006230 [Asterophora parasitica]|uniref:BTB domain-containing protein n=1 Tax=Asterophora parasitica TaxID=117018 RepID=A0A9P7KF00_9AGAR|nr:hypothetical protein DXG03_006230 [Asterophora parasitica]
MPALRSNPRLQPVASPSNTKSQRHPRYYMPQGNIVIKVQNTLFKLDLSVLHEKSLVLRVITPPQQGGKLRLHSKGFDDEHPFVLPEISDNSYPFTSATVDDWMIILNLAHKYEMDDVRALAVARLHASPIDPVRKIAIWDKYHLESHLLAPSYVELCQRVEPLTLGMTMTIGLKNFTKLAAARDLYHQRTLGVGCCKTYTPAEKQTMAEEIVTQMWARPMRC